MLVCYDFQIAVVMVCTRSEAAIRFESAISQRITLMTIEPQYVWLVVGIALSMGMPSTGGLAYYLFAALSVVLLLRVRSRIRKIVVGDIAKGSGDEDFIGHNAVVESGFYDPSPERGREAVNLRVAEQWVKEFGKLTKTNNTMIVPAQLGDVATMVSAVMGTMGNIRADRSDDQMIPGVI